MTSPRHFPNDPIFYCLESEMRNLRGAAKTRGVTPYIIDRMRVEEWVSNGCKPCITNSVLLVEPPNANFIIHTKNTFYGIYYYPYNLNTPLPSKEFNCFMNRLDPIRQSWLYQLVRRKIFDQGYISFNMDLSRSNNFKDRDPREIFEEHFRSHCAIFEDEHNWVKDKVPYRNFHSNDDLTDIILDSKFSIVLETYFDNNNVQTYSEKIFRALQIPRPWILFAHMGAVKYLRNLGFDVLDDIVDHEYYDNIPFAIDRQTNLLDLAEKLINSNIDYQRAIQAAEHNQQLLQTFNRTWKQDYMDQILYAASLV